MDKINEEQLKLEIAHIFDSGANELRVFEMVKNFIDNRNLVDVSGECLHPYNSVRTYEITELNRCSICGKVLMVLAIHSCVLSKAEMGDDLCKYCTFEKKGVYGVNVGCEGSRCDDAYENYLDKYMEGNER